jgi:hypothetical protein
MAVLKPYKRLGTAALLALAVLLYFRPARAADPAQPHLELFEEKIKAGLVYNFLKYTTWPAGIMARSNGHLRVCLLGEDTSDNYLYPLAGRTAQQYVITIAQVENVAQTGDCSLLFVHRSREDSLPALFRFLKGKHTLTISDIDQFAAQGGMVEFGKNNEQIDLLINKKAVDSAGLVIQSRLLKLARLVNGHNG